MKIFMFSVDTSNVVAPGVEGFKAYNFSDTCAVPGFDWFKSNRIVYRHSETADTSMLSPMQQEYRRNVTMPCCDTLDPHPDF
jgi:hypothetical protein